jgi:hypothetical protein
MTTGLECRSWATIWQALLPPASAPVSFHHAGAVPFVMFPHLSMVGTGNDSAYLQLNGSMFFALALPGTDQAAQSPYSGPYVLQAFDVLTLVGGTLSETAVTISGYYASYTE